MEVPKKFGRFGHPIEEERAAGEQGKSLTAVYEAIF
jgi:hypothetical protein